MDIYKLNKKKNKLVLSCWLVICIVLTLAYTIEFIIGNRTLYYLTQYLMVTWIPLIVTYGVGLIIGRGDTRIRYLAGLLYMLFYTYTQMTSQSLGTFSYIFPMICALVVYDDSKLMDLLCSISVLINIVYITLNVSQLENVNRSTITFFEIQMACLILSFIFLHMATNLLRYTNNKLEQLSKEVNIDELTNVYNRYWLNNFIKEKFYNPEYSEITIAITDIDSFKNINDTYGHKFGDLVLRKITAILKESILDCDETYAVRLGGDEFAIISSIINKDTMYKICKNICKEVNNVNLYYGDKEVHLSVSIGVANSKDDKCNSYNKLYETADTRLYKVKNNGKSNVAKE